MKLRIVLIALVLQGVAFGQYQTVPGTNYPSLEAVLNAKPAVQVASGVPSGVCTAGKDLYLNSATTPPTLYYCDSVNHWTPVQNTLGIAGVPLCSGFSPVNGKVLQYTTGGTPNPCYGVTDGGTGTMGAVTITGTSNQIVVTGTCTGTTTISCTLSLPSGLQLPGTINKVTISTPTNAATLTIADGKTLTVNRTLTLDGTDGVTITFPASSTTVASLGLTNAFTGRQDATAALSTAPMKTGTSLPGTCVVGDLYFKSDAVAGQNIYECAATNTWTQQLNSGGGGGGSPGGSSGDIQVNIGGVFTGAPIADCAVLGKGLWYTASTHTFSCHIFVAADIPALPYQTPITGAPSTWPTTFAPSAHAATHQNGGSDEVATSTAGANAIPKADGTGKLAIGWFPTLNQNTTGTAANVTGVVAEANGGTGAANTPGAAGHVLRSNGTHYLDSALLAIDIPNIAESQVTGLVSDLAAKAPATTGTVPLSGNGSGGTTATTAAGIVGLFGSCSGTLSLGADGNCHATGGVASVGGQTGVIPGEGDGTVVQMGDNAPGADGTVMVYLRGNTSAGGCTIVANAIVCGTPNGSHAITFFELAANGSNGFSIYGADSQTGNGCIQLPADPSTLGAGKVLQDSGTTATMQDGNVCRVMQWAALTGGGTVTTVAAHVPGPFTVTVVNPTATPDIQITWSTGQTPGRFLATCGSATVVSLCLPTAADLPVMAAGNMPAFTGGDVTSIAGSLALNLNTVNSNVGSCGDSTHVCSLVITAKGLITSATPILVSGGSGGGGNQPFVVTCTPTPSTVLGSTHGQGKFPYVEVRNAANQMVGVGTRTLNTTTGDVTIACAKTELLSIYISGYANATATTAVTFSGATSVTIKPDILGIASQDVKAQAWSGTGGSYTYTEFNSFSVDTSYTGNLTFDQPESGIAIFAHK